MSLPYAENVQHKKNLIVETDASFVDNVEIQQDMKIVDFCMLGSIQLNYYSF